MIQKFCAIVQRAIDLKKPSTGACGPFPDISGNNADAHGTAAAREY
jgi:hypothetical protein